VWPFIVGIGTVWGVLGPAFASASDSDKKNSNFYKRMNPKEFEVVSRRFYRLPSFPSRSWHGSDAIALFLLWQGGKYYDASKAHGHH
jgi:hypothetical protein